VHQHVERDRAVGGSKRRIALDLGDARIAADERAEPQRAVGDGAEVGCRRSAMAVQQRSAFEFLELIDEDPMRGWVEDC